MGDRDEVKIKYSISFRVWSMHYNHEYISKLMRKAALFSENKNISFVEKNHENISYTALELNKSIYLSEYLSDIDKFYRIVSSNKELLGLFDEMHAEGVLWISLFINKGAVSKSNYGIPREVIIFAETSSVGIFVEDYTEFESGNPRKIWIVPSKNFHRT